MNYEEAWATLNGTIVKNMNKKYSMLNKSETALMIDDQSTILAQLDMLHFIYTVMESIENYARACDSVDCDVVTREGSEKCVD